MSRTILLDSGPLGLITNPRASKEAAGCGEWLVQALIGGATVLVPAIADYEVRRELVRARRTAGIGRLDALIARVGFLPITPAAMRQAAAFWAEARQQGRPTAADAALDGDVILAAQSFTLNRTDAIVATTNPKHLSRFVAAELWVDIAWPASRTDERVPIWQSRHGSPSPKPRGISTRSSRCPGPRRRHCALGGTLTCGADRRVMKTRNRTASTKPKPNSQNQGGDA